MYFEALQFFCRNELSIYIKLLSHLLKSVIARLEQLHYQDRAKKFLLKIKEKK